MFGDVPLACFWLGMMYRFGKSVPRNVIRARQLFTVACDSEDVSGGPCDELGSMTVLGEGGKPNPSAAAKIYRRGCDKNDPESCAAFAVLVLSGHGAASDRSMARASAHKSCQLGYRAGCELVSRFPAVKP